jgi:hypothetical protein
MISEPIVQAVWPEAELYEADCRLPKGVIQPASNLLELSQLRVVWWAPEGVLIITSNG